MAILLSITLNPLVNNIGNLFKLKTKLTKTILTFTILGLLTIIFLALVAPLIYEQFSIFTSELRLIVENFFEEQSQKSGWLADLMNNSDLQATIMGLVDNIQGAFSENLNNLLNILETLSSIIVSLIVVIVLTFMILLESSNLENQSKQYLTTETHQKWIKIYHQISKVVTSYIGGQLLIALIGGMVTFIFLSFMPLPDHYSEIAMATIVTIFSLIPLIGVFIGASIVVILTLLIDIKLALIVAMFFIFINK